MPLTPEQWRKAKEILASALEMDFGRRAAFIEEACGPDLELKREVESLLRYETRLPGDPQQNDTFSPASAITARDDLLNGRYLLGQAIGKGGFSTTYLAYDKQLRDRKVVVKVLTQLVGDAYVRRKFDEELTALSTLEHPNIVAPLDSGKLRDGSPFLVMQYAEGKTLREVFADGPLSFARVASIVRQIGKALGAAHAKGIYHRDIKPENVIVQRFDDGAEHVRLIDFGIARISAAPAELTRVVGTIHYMAPEQMRGIVSARSDIYALGVLSYEALTGCLPFDSPHLIELIEMQRAGVAAAPAELRPGLSPVAGRLILQALSFDASQRPTDASAFGDALAASLLEMRADAGKPASGLRPAVLVAGGAVLAGILFVVAGIAFRPARLSAIPHPIPPSAPAPEYSKLAASLSIALETQGAGALHDGMRPASVLLPQGQSFRFQVTPSAAGHLYIYAETGNAPGLHILFPSPTSNLGVSAMSAGGGVPIPEKSWFNFGSEPAVEKVWFVWQNEEQNELESSKSWANPVNRGEIASSSERARIRALLAGGKELKRNGAAGWSLRAGNGLSVGFVQIEHR